MEKQLAVTVPESRRLTHQADEKREISVLTNSIDYFLGSVFIINSIGVFRLVVMHNGRLLVDEVYKTSRGSKIAFYRFCRDRAWKEGVKPRWSPYYNPDVEFLDETWSKVKKLPFH